MAVKPRVSLKAFLAAVADTDQDVVFYVDSHRGEILKMSRSMPLAELARFKTMTDRDPDRFVKVPKPTAEESYGDMDAFMASVKDKKLQDRLQLSIRGGGTLRNFLDALSPNPIEKERWYKFRQARIQTRAQDWMRQNGLEPAP